MMERGPAGREQEVAAVEAHHRRGRDAARVHGHGAAHVGRAGNAGAGDALVRVQDDGGAAEQAVLVGAAAHHAGVRGEAAGAAVGRVVVAEHDGARLDGREQVRLVAVLPMVVVDDLVVGGGDRAHDRVDAVREDGRARLADAHGRHHVPDVLLVAEHEVVLGSRGHVSALLRIGSHGEQGSEGEGCGEKKRGTRAGARARGPRGGHQVHDTLLRDRGTLHPCLTPHEGHRYAVSAPGAGQQRTLRAPAKRFNHTAFGAEGKPRASAPQAKAGP